jgi:citrate/tricarballylate utilization protein
LPAEVRRVVRPLDLEGARIFRICNACRYCEGFCAVYPAMERRTSFPPADLTYLANLCHNCGECYYACQYSPPHEFAVNVPLLLAQIRLQSYEQFAWPGWLAQAYRANGIMVGVILACCLGALLCFAPGSFYSTELLFQAVGAYVAIALMIGVIRFWRYAGGSVPAGTHTLAEGFRNAMTLRYLAGDGFGSRRMYHHFTFYGFLLCFASTSVAALYHYVLGWDAPYPYFSLPVILGAAGGLSLLTGTAGLFALKSRRGAEIKDEKQAGMDTGFIALLFFSSLTGLLLLALRETRSMRLLLAIHLGFVLALLLTLPYGKFVHGAYRLAALARNAIERNAPTAE